MRGSTAAVEVLCIGNELLLGETLDTNAPWIARVLAAEGIRVSRKTTVGDDVEQIRAALDAALRRTGTVICTGGLGPTRDDLTRHAVAELYGRPLQVDETWVAVLRERYERRGMRMPEINRTQGERPEGATLLPNEHGTAPGIAIDAAGLGLTVLLPGVPSEMQRLLADRVLPLLRQRLSPHGRIESRVLRTAGLTEAALAERIDDIANAAEPVTLAFLPQLAGVDLRLTAWGLAPAEAQRAFDAVTLRLRERLGSSIYTEDDADLAAVVGRMLSEQRLTLGLAESCTGGLVAKRLSDEAGASAFLHAGFVTYSNESKRDLLGVNVATLATHGAVSEQCVREMALGARRAAGADTALAVTGVAGPGGGTEEKPVGTVWIAVVIAETCTTRLLRLHGERTEIRERAAQAALELLRRCLIDRVTERAAR
jgi:nicotinamide-nucleotide amidase